MKNFFKITKLNLSVNSETLNLFSSFLDTKALPEEEIVCVNSDKIIGISEVMKTGIKDDDRLCHKLYFTSSEFWAVKRDDNLLNLIEHL